MSQQIRTAAFIGLGVMGYPMAGHLARAGIEVRVYNRTAAKAEAWVAEYGGSHHPTPGEATQGADLVLVCVGNDDDVREVVQRLHEGGAGGGDGSFFMREDECASLRVLRAQRPELLRPDLAAPPPATTPPPVQDHKVDEDATAGLLGMLRGLLPGAGAAAR